MRWQENCTTVYMSEQLDFFLLIPCFNNLSGLQRSLSSVVYDRAKYGVVIVDDGSDVAITVDALNLPTPAVTAIIRLEANTGITSALNRGLEWLRGRADYRFVARLDCGDLCHPGRFFRQVDYLTSHPEIDLLGTWTRFQDFSSGFSYPYRTPLERNGIIKGMHFRNLFIHPTVMWRATVLAKIDGYPTDLPHAEDYGFFYQILQNGQAAILPEELVTCEINPNGLSLRNRRRQLKSRIKTVLRYRTNAIWGLLGAVKLQILLLIPYRILLLFKSILA